MQDELDRAAESVATSSTRPHVPSRLSMLDVVGAIDAAEKIAGSRVFGDVADGGDLGRTLAEACALADRSERAAVVAPTERLASARDSMRRAANARLGIVAHAVAGHGAEDLPALTDLGWGVLCAAGPEDSFDLTLIARRAAEDACVPFLVVHGLGRVQHGAGRAVAMVGIPQDKAVQSFLGKAREDRARADAARASAGDRAFAERVPFALGAALREYGSMTGRRHDTFDKTPLGESPLVLLGAGAVGDALLSATGELRARGYDVGAVNVKALRPFPGPRLVKALARALAVTVLEPVDEPFAHGALLARDVKAAFTDALTWVPGFPGIGRIPKLFIGATGSVFDVSDLAAVCENMLADERGRRVFSFLDVEHSLPRAPEPPRALREVPNDERPEREIAFRFVLDETASAEAVLSAVGVALAHGVGLRVQGIVTATSPGAGVVVDVLASRDHASGGMARRVPGLVLATERGVATAGAVVTLPDGGVLGVLGADAAGTVPEAARTIARERRARVLLLPLGEEKKNEAALVGAVTGAALALAARALKSPLDAGEIARLAGETSGEHARRAFESTRDALSAAARSEGASQSPPRVA